MLSISNLKRRLPGLTKHLGLPVPGQNEMRNIIFKEVFNKTSPPDDTTKIPKYVYAQSEEEATLEVCEQLFFDEVDNVGNPEIVDELIVEEDEENDGSDDPLYMIN